MDLTLNILNNGQVQHVKIFFFFLNVFQQWSLFYTCIGTCSSTKIISKSSNLQFRTWTQPDFWQVAPVLLKDWLDTTNQHVSTLPFMCSFQFLSLATKAPRTLRDDDWTPFSESDFKCSITSPELPIHQITSHKAAVVWSVPRSYNSLTVIQSLHWTTF